MCRNGSCAHTVSHKVSNHKSQSGPDNWNPSTQLEFCSRTGCTPMTCWSKYLVLTVYCFLYCLIWFSAFNVTLKSITNGHTCAMCTKAQLVTMHKWSSIPNLIVFPIPMPMVVLGVTVSTVSATLIYFLSHFIPIWQREPHEKKMKPPTNNIMMVKLYTVEMVFKKISHSVHHWYDNICRQFQTWIVSLWQYSIPNSIHSILQNSNVKNFMKQTKLYARL